MTNRPEIYVSVDIETDGPIPGPNSMLSLGAAAFYSDTGVRAGTRYYTMQPLAGAEGDPETMAWWATQPEAWAAVTDESTRMGAPQAMRQFVEWVESLPGLPVFVAYPAGFDFTFVYWYMRQFVGRSPFSFSAIDIKTYAMACLELGYRASTKKNMPREWFEDTGKHTHRADEDAVEQGKLFMNMLAWRRARRLEIR